MPCPGARACAAPNSRRHRRAPEAAPAPRGRRARPGRRSRRRCGGERRRASGSRPPATASVPGTKREGGGRAGRAAPGSGCPGRRSARRRGRARGRRSVSSRASPRACTTISRQPMRFGSLSSRSDHAAGRCPPRPRAACPRARRPPAASSRPASPGGCSSRRARAVPAATVGAVHLEAQAPRDRRPRWRRGRRPIGGDGVSVLEGRDLRLVEHVVDAHGAVGDLDAGVAVDGEVAERVGAAPARRR